MDHLPVGGLAAQNACRHATQDRRAQDAGLDDRRHPQLHPGDIGEQLHPEGAARETPARHGPPDLAAGPVARAQRLE